MKVRMTWKVYGPNGRCQKEAAHPSVAYDFSNEYKGTRLIEISNEDVTGSCLYSLVSITRDSEEDCWDEFEWQLCDGIFENCDVGVTRLVEKVEFLTVQELRERERTVQK